MSHQSFLDHLQLTHNIKLTSEELDAIALFYNQQSEIWERRLANEPNAVYYEILGGRIIAAVALGVVGIFLAPVLGLGVVASALIGAAIGWRLVGAFESKKQDPKTTQDPKAAQTFGFNSAPSIAPIGGVIPLVFTNKQLNPNGGVRTSGVVLHSRVDTFGGVQKVYSLYGLSLGELGEINESSILINNQPRNTFFQNELTTITRLGSTNQNVTENFPYYSQCIAVSINNQLGISKRGKHVGSTGINSIVTVSSDDFDSISATDKYATNGQEFLINSKNQGNNTFQADKQLSLVNNGDIFAIYRVKYQTSKACSEVQLNLVGNLWARDSNNTLVQHGLVFGVIIDGTFISTFLMANKSESDIRRRIIIRNLPFTKHVIELTPFNGVSNANNIYKLIDNQQITVINTGVFISGRNVQIEFENTPGATSNVNEINTIVNLDKKQTSSDRGAVIQLTTVNEIVYPNDLAHPYLSNYRDVATGALIATASNRLQSDPAPSWEITKGIKGRLHIAAGFANSSSNDTQLTDITANFVQEGVSPGFIIRNLDRGIESPIIASNIHEIKSQNPLFWRQGDRFLVYHDNQSINYFPDVYVWSLTKRKGGLGGLLRGTQLADFFIDYESIVRSRKFCKNNNFFWDGAIDQSVSWAQWASQESMGSLLFPTRIGGKFGLIPEFQSPPVALFNASNILPDTYTEDYAPQQKLNCTHITYTDNSNDVPRDYTVSVMTNDARNGTQSLFAESIRLPAVTNKAQAIRVGQVYLKSRILQDRVIQFGTGLQGYGLREGDLIIVQHLTTEIDKECSGFVLDAGTFSGNTQKLTLSAPSKPGIDGNYSAAVYRLETSQIQQNLSCSIISEGNPKQNYIVINGLSSPLLAPRENFTGDYVVIGRDTTHRRTYRVQKIEPQDNGSVNLTAILWVPEILSSDGLVTVD